MYIFLAGVRVPLTKMLAGMNLLTAEMDLPEMDLSNPEKINHNNVKFMLSYATLTHPQVV